MPTCTEGGERLKTIIEKLTEQIIKDCEQLRDLEWYPTHDADADDDNSKAYKNRIQRLREIRNELEQLWTGASV